ncbi:hypothetical protein SFOMI_2350 [Sphingobium fuliginis]|uniref:Uncharacterized protein n=1 Tax=Sphingobium fuliginis (strain ATCC 27551) TaxID=336203 RepID=A0A292ZE92_SPHSA|nr:hypothetical protein SFOMI_2350 [Sphingobium fuliginis]
MRGVGHAPLFSASITMRVAVMGGSTAVNSLSSSPRRRRSISPPL